MESAGKSAENKAKRFASRHGEKSFQEDEVLRNTIQEA